MQDEERVTSLKGTLFSLAAFCSETSEEWIEKILRINRLNTSQLQTSSSYVCGVCFQENRRLFYSGNYRALSNIFMHNYMWCTRSVAGLQNCKRKGMFAPSWQEVSVLLMTSIRRALFSNACFSFIKPPSAWRSLIFFWFHSHFWNLVLIFCFWTYFSTFSNKYTFQRKNI